MKTSITSAELKQFIESNKNLLLIDVRSKSEYMDRHIPFAGNLPVEIIESGHFIPEPEKMIITVCAKGGGRSERAANYFRDHGHNETYYLEGGTFAWFENQS